MRNFCFILFCATLICCNKDRVYGPPSIVGETFSFEKRNETVHVFPSTTGYNLKATAEIGRDGINGTVVWPIPSLTTAIFGVHYSYPEILFEFHPESLRFMFEKSKEVVSARIILFPENIKEELQLVYRHPYFRQFPQKNCIDTITISLIPQH